MYLEGHSLITFLRSPQNSVLSAGLSTFSHTFLNTPIFNKHSFFKIPGSKVISQIYTTYTILCSTEVLGKKWIISLLIRSWLTLEEWMVRWKTKINRALQILLWVEIIPKPDWPKLVPMWEMFKAALCMIWCSHKDILRAGPILPFLDK